MDGNVTMDGLAQGRDNRQPEGNVMEISGISSSLSSFSMTGMSKKPPEMTEEMAGNLASGMISKNDEDSDGFLSLAETGLSEDSFGQVDADGDGLLSADELTSGVMAQNEDLRSLAPPPPVEMGSEEESALLESLSQQTSQTGYSTYQSAMQDFMDSLLTGEESLSLTA